MAEQVTLESLFGAVVSTYTAAQAVEDGALHDVTETAREAGFRCKVVVTSNVWERCVRVPEDCAGVQDESGRLWDVVWMTFVAAKRAPPGETLVKVKLHVVSKAKHLTHTPPLVELWAISDGGDEGRQLITILFPMDGGNGCVRALMEAGLWVPVSAVGDPRGVTVWVYATGRKLSGGASEALAELSDQSVEDY